MAKNRTATHIFIALFLGAAVGLCAKSLNHPWIHSVLIDGVFLVLGQSFLNGLKMLVVPIVITSLINGVYSLDDVNRLGRLGGKAFTVYLITTAIAVTMALGFSLWAAPGQGFDLTQQALGLTALPTNLQDPSQSISILHTLIGLIPGNPLESALHQDMLPLMSLAILVGIAMHMSPRHQAKRLYELSSDVQAICQTLLQILMKIAPYGVFSLIARLFATAGLAVILPLASYCFVLFLLLSFQLLVVYPSILWTQGLSPLLFLKKMKPTMLFAFGSSSSNATLPVNMKACIDELGVDPSIAGFMLPLGATINMDGTAIMQGVATVFIANAYQIPLGNEACLMVILMAILSSIGTAGTPGIGVLTLGMVLHQAGLPIEGISLIIGVDRLVDMLRTTVNITGDAALTCVVAKSEAMLNLETYNRPLTT